MFSNIVEKTIKNYVFFPLAISLSSTYNKKDCKKDFLIKIRWSPFPVCFSFHKTYIKLQFYFWLWSWLMFKYFAIHVFFTRAWDFTSAFLTGVISDRCEVSLHLERVNNIRSICGDRSKFNLLHCGLPKWNHTCNQPLRACLHETQVNSNRFQISNCFEKSLRLQDIFTTANLEISNSFQKLSRLHSDFTWATFQTIVRF